MRTTCVISLVCCLFVVTLAVGCGKKPVRMERPPRTIVFFGDSVVYGHGVDAETESFYSRIANIMKSGIYGDVKTVNAGMSGDDTSEALRRVTTDVTAHNPDIVIIAFGLNDCMNRTMTTENFRHNIENMIAAMPSKTQVILATSNSFLETGRSAWEDLNDSLDPFMMEIRAIARDRALTLIDVHDAWKDQLKQDQRHIESYYIDPTHPSAKGHGVIYEVYMNALRRILMK